MKNKITYNTASEGGGMYIEGNKGKLDKTVIKNIEFYLNEIVNQKTNARQNYQSNKQIKK